MQTKKPRNKGKTPAGLFIFVGVLLIALAIALYSYNYIQDRAAGNESAQVVSELKERIPESPIPINKMPKKKVGDELYAGYLSIPSLSLELPVIAEWNYSRLKKAPCRYYGWTTTDDLVIAGHNYKSHFAPLTRIRKGDGVTFTDMYGNVNSYQVADIERLQPDDVDKMINSEWDLTLYTCTYGAAERITIRCRRV